MPAHAMITPKPSLRAFLANSSTSPAVRCADITRISYGMFISPSLSAAFLTTLKSFALPIMTATFFMVPPDNALSEITAVFRRFSKISDNAMLTENPSGFQVPDFIYIIHVE